MSHRGGGGGETLRHLQRLSARGGVGEESEEGGVFRSLTINMPIISHQGPDISRLDVPITIARTPDGHGGSPLVQMDFCLLKGANNISFNKNLPYISIKEENNFKEIQSNHTNTKVQMRFKYHLLAIVVNFKCISSLVFIAFLCYNIYIIFIRVFL